MVPILESTCGLVAVGGAGVQAARIKVGSLLFVVKSVIGFFPWVVYRLD